MGIIIFSEKAHLGFELWCEQKPKASLGFRRVMGWEASRRQSLIDVCEGCLPVCKMGGLLVTAAPFLGKKKKKNVAFTLFF